MIDITDNIIIFTPPPEKDYGGEEEPGEERRHRTGSLRMNNLILLSLHYDYNTGFV